jgi:hypothetical protein
VSNLSVNTITDASGGSTASINGLTPQASNMQPFNRIINGAMTVDQRNAGAAVTANASYPVDRWSISNTANGTFSAQQVSDTPVGFSSSLKITITAAQTANTGNLAPVQVIEGNNIADLGWGAAVAKTVTLSFWVRSSLTGTFGGSLRNSGSSRSYPFTYTISVADTWEYKTITIAGDTSGTWLTTNGIGISVRFSLYAVASSLQAAGAWYNGNATGATGQTQLASTNGATFYITGVQLEAGSSASSFAHEFVGDTLQKCERYYQKVPPLVGHGNSTNFWGAVAFRTEMRVQPAISLPSNSLNWTDGYASDYPSTNANPSWTDYSAHSGGRFGTANHTAVSADARRGTMLLQTPTTLNCDAEL